MWWLQRHCSDKGSLPGGGEADSGLKEQEVKAREEAGRSMVAQGAWQGWGEVPGENGVPVVIAEGAPEATVEGRLACLSFLWFFKCGL